MAAATHIQILLVIDTDYVVANSRTPSRDADNPTRIDNSAAYVIDSQSGGMAKSEGTPDLKLAARPGDKISVAATSISKNADAAVILCGIMSWPGDRIVSEFVSRLSTVKAAVMPNPDTANGLPPTLQAMTFAGYDAKVVKAGADVVYVRIALSTLAADGETQKLYGYFYWATTLTVAG